MSVEMSKMKEEARKRETFVAEMVEEENSLQRKIEDLEI